MLQPIILSGYCNDSLFANQTNQITLLAPLNRYGPHNKYASPGLRWSSRQLKFLTTGSGRDLALGVNGCDFKGIETAEQKLSAKI